MTAAKLNLVLEQGATFEKKFRWLDSEGAAIDLTGWNAELVIREQFGEETLVLGTQNGGIALLPEAPAPDPVDGLSIVPLTAIYVRSEESVTRGIAFRVGRYALDLIDPDSARIRILEGSVTINPEVKK